MAALEKKTRCQLETQRRTRVIGSNTVTVTASRFDSNSRWTIKGEVITPDGKLSPMSDDDNSYADLEDALESGFRIFT